MKVKNILNKMSTSLSQFQSECKTGDIVLCSGTRWLSYIIEWFFSSPISHVGIVYRDEQDKVFILESKLDTGVVLTPIDEFFKRYTLGDYSAIYTRKLNIKRNQFFNDTFKYILKQVVNKKYDTNPNDWIKILVTNGIEEYQKTNEFFCSALVAYCFIKLGILESDLPWSIVSPNLFSSTSDKLSFKCNLEKEILVSL